MKTLFRKIILFLTGARPMIKLGYAFTDMLSGARVYDFVDQKGRLWLATDRWSIFRMKNTDKTDQTRRDEIMLSSYSR